MWNPGAGGANSSSSAQSQRQHVVPGNGDHHIVQRGKTSGGTGDGASAIAHIPLDGSSNLRRTYSVLPISKRPRSMGNQFYVSIVNDPKILDSCIRFVYFY